MNMTLSTPKHPIEECIPDLESLIEEVSQRDFSFDEEMTEVRSLSFSLFANPDEDITEFNRLYSELQSNISRVATVLIGVMSEKALWQKWLGRTTGLYRKARNRLLSTRSDIKELRNKELQEAKVHEEIPELIDLKELIERVIDDLDLSIDIIEVKKEELDKANSNLARQQKVVESMIGLGYAVGGGNQP